jgi:hypothetical protein
MKKLSTDDLDLLWIGSFRYFLGRMTISTHAFCDALINNWGAIPNRAKAVIVRDLSEEIKRDDDDRLQSKEHKSLGHDCDSQKWREVMRFIQQPQQGEQ